MSDDDQREISYETIYSNHSNYDKDNSNLDKPLLEEEHNSICKCCCFLLFSCFIMCNNIVIL